jgi:hypothetical protein
MTDDTILPFAFPAVHAKKVTATFDGGRLTLNGGVMHLAMPSGVSVWPTIWPGCSRIGAIRGGSCTALSTCSARPAAKPGGKPDGRVPTEAWS